MDLNQISRVVTWLDDERRADRVELTKLLQRLETQERELVGQAKRIAELEERLVRTQAGVYRRRVHPVRRARGSADEPQHRATQIPPVRR